MIAAPGDDELRPERQDQDERRVLGLRRQQSDQFQSRRVGPMEVFDDDGRGTAEGQRAGRVPQHGQRAGAPDARRIQGADGPTGRTRCHHVADGQRRLGDIERVRAAHAMGRQERLDPRCDLGARRGSAFEAELLLEILDDRMEGRARVEWRAPPFECSRLAAARDGLDEGPHQSGLPDAGVAGNQQDLALGVARLLPRLQQGGELAIAADQARSVRRLVVQPPSRSSPLSNEVGMDRIVHALEPREAEIFGDKYSGHETLGGLADDDRPGRRERLESSRHVQRRSERRFPRVFGRPELADDHAARVDADTNGDTAQRLRDLWAVGLGDRLERRRDLERGANGSLGVVLVCSWIPETGVAPVTGKTLDVPVPAFDDRFDRLLVTCQ